MTTYDQMQWNLNHKIRDRNHRVSLRQDLKRRWKYVKFMPFKNFNPIKSDDMPLDILLTNYPEYRYGYEQKEEYL